MQAANPSIVLINAHIDQVAFIWMWLEAHWARHRTAGFATTTATVRFEAVQNVAPN